MSFSQAALLVVGAVLIILYFASVSPVVKLVAGIAVCVLVFLEILLAHRQA